MTVHVLFGTESGNAEMVAFDIGEELGIEAEDLADLDVADLNSDTFYLIICSTHGEGELPQSAVPFAEALSDQAPNLTGLRYAMLGLGDSTYPNYSKGSDRIDELLRGLGAERVGEFGRHDAAGRDDPSELGLDWARAVVQTQAEVPVAA